MSRKFHSMLFAGHACDVRLL